MSDLRIFGRLEHEAATTPPLAEQERLAVEEVWELLNDPLAEFEAEDQLGGPRPPEGVR